MELLATRTENKAYSSKDESETYFIDIKSLWAFIWNI